MQIDPAKVHVIYWGIKHDVFFPQLQSKEEVAEKLKVKYDINSNFFLSVSCNVERKRTHLLVDSYLELCKQSPANDLVLIWNDPPSFLKDKIENSLAKNRVHFLSYVPDDDLALLYNGATAFFFPSMYEGFGLPVLEAMACGTPVVTCRNSSLQEIGNDAVIYVEEPIVESLIRAMGAFENSAIDCSYYHQAGIKRASAFTWEQTACQTLNVYEQALANADI
jgi:glycosyltransferase involved in cell wall biosynthesis